MRKFIIPITLFLMVGIWAAGAKADGLATGISDEEAMTPRVFLPVVTTKNDCVSGSNRSYASGFAEQFDTDNPVRPAYNHADKNIALRGYVPNNSSSLNRGLVDYGSDDPAGPPQFATLFSPHQVPPFSVFYQIRGWDWSPSPDPGRRTGPVSFPEVTALGLDVAPGTSLHVPSSGYDIGGGMEVLVLFADEDTVTLQYTREDSAAQGYTLHIDNICTDPNLLSLYNTLDRPNGPRYEYPSSGYNLPTMPAGQQFGTSSGQEVVIAVADTGTFQDPRSCNDWWQIRPGFGGSCSRP